MLHGSGIYRLASLFPGGRRLFVFLWVLFDEKAGGERLNAVLGLWLAVSFWILGLSDHSTATINTIITGAVLAVLAGWSLTNPPAVAQHFGTYGPQGYR